MIDLWEMLQRLAIGWHTDDDRAFWQGVCIEISFGSPEKIIFNKMKEIEYLPEEYFRVVEKYDSFLVGKFGLRPTRVVHEKFFYKDNADYVWSIGWLGDFFSDEKNFYFQKEIYISNNGSIIMRNLYDESLEFIASSFFEFMNDCIFGERYLEFNGGDASDNTYGFLKTFRENMEKDYANMRSEDRCQEQQQMQQRLDELEAKIRYEESRGNCVRFEK